MTKLIFLGCLSSTRYQDTCENAIKLIHAIDTNYKIIEDTPCCGALSFHITPDEKLKEHVDFVNNWFKKNNVSEIVTICAGCYNYLSHYYPMLLGDEFNIPVTHILQFIGQPENLEKLNLKYEGKKLRVNYHDACHLKNADSPIIEEPRQILQSIDKIELQEMENEKEFSICCGAGGGVYSIFKENSDFNTDTIFSQMRRGKILLTGCPFCYTAFNRVKEETQFRKSIMKIEDFIAKIKFEGGEGLA